MRITIMILFVLLSASNSFSATKISIGCRFTAIVDGEKDRIFGNHFVYHNNELFTRSGKCYLDTEITKNWNLQPLCTQQYSSEFKNTSCFHLEKGLLRYSWKFGELPYKFEIKELIGDYSCLVTEGWPDTIPLTEVKKITQYILIESK